MPGISNDTVQDLRARIARFRPTYVHDWDNWLITPPAARPRQLISIMGKWQACRGNTLRDAHKTTTAVHPPPYIDGLLGIAQASVLALHHFDMQVKS